MTHCGHIVQFSSDKAVVADTKAPIKEGHQGDVDFGNVQESSYGYSPHCSLS